jgi:threonine/homoserine/homoserine lactone efflux protein
MTHALILGSLLGLFSGIIPGPFSGLVAATALQQGFRSGLKLALVPLVSEGTVLTVTALAISRMPEGMLRWMGIGGGLLVLYVAWRTLRQSKGDPRTDVAASETRRVGEAVAVALLSPAPWVFWLLIGSPLFLSAWNRGWGAGLVFFGTFMFFMVGINVGWAALAAYGQRQLSDTWHRRLMKGAASGLAVAGCVLVWQSWVGNFHEMVAGSEAVVDSVEDRVNGGERRP